MKLRLLGADLQAGEHLTPVFLFHGVASELLKDFVDLFVVLYVVNISLIDLILPHPVGEFAHFVHFEVQDFLHCFMNVDLKGCGIDLVNFDPYLSYLLPDLE